MLRNFLGTTFLLVLSFLQIHGQVSVIPKPEFFNLQMGSLPLEGEFKVCVSNAKLIRNAKIFIADLKKYSNVKAVLNKNEWNPNGPGQINLNMTKPDEKNPDTNSYHILVGKKSVMILSSSPTGIFYGLQTLLQLITTADNKIGRAHV